MDEVDRKCEVGHEFRSRNEEKKWYHTVLVSIQLSTNIVSRCNIRYEARQQPRETNSPADGVVAAD